MSQAVFLEHREKRVFAAFENPFDASPDTRGKFKMGKKFVCYHDKPLLFYVKDTATNNTSLALWGGGEGECEVWYLAKANAKQRKRLQKRESDILSLFKSAKQIRRITINRTTSVVHMESMHYRDIPEGTLPPAGLYLPT